MDKFLTSISKRKASPSTSREEKEESDEDNDCDNKIEPSTKKTKEPDFSDKWLLHINFKNWLSKRQQEDGHFFAYCKVCNRRIRNHKSALDRHMSRQKHITAFLSRNATMPIEQAFLQKKDEVLKKRAELKISAFLALHNLPLSLADDLIPFLSNTFPDSDIIKSVNLGRTKTTVAIKSILGPILTEELVSQLKKVPFSIVMDETTDIGVKKQCALAVIFCDESDMIICTKFLDIYEVKSGKAEDLTNALLTWLESKQIPLTNFVGFASDTTNSMVGQNNSVFSHLKKHVPHIACIKCSCHIIHLVASKACLKLPRFVEDLLRSIGSHFSRSSVRQEKLREFQEFFKVEIHKILSPATTRWLSLHACVARALEQYDVLREYFRVEVFDDPSKITDDIQSTLNNKLTKIYLEFMQYTLELFTDFNRLFQSEKPLLHTLKPQVHQLIKNLASNYMQFNYCKTTEAYKIEFANPRFFLPLEKIYLGVAAQTSIDELSKEIPEPKTEIKDFRKTCLSFYIESLKQLTQRFDFSDPLFDLIEDVLDPCRAQRFNTNDLSNVLKRFPNISSDIDVTELHKEWKRHAFLDHQALNLPPNLPVEEYWKKILKMEQVTGEPMFPNLKKIVMLLLVLPFSNASVERIFSQLKLIKSETRNRLNTDTISALMATKANIKDVIKFEPTKAMLQAKLKYNKNGDGEGAD